MKSFFYAVYAFFFNISAALFPLKKNRVCFLSMHNEGFCDSLGSVCDYLKKNRSDADDIHQEVFIRYITNRPEFENENHFQFGEKYEKRFRI